MQRFRRGFAWGRSKSDTSASPATDYDLSFADKFTFYSTIERVLPAERISKYLVSNQRLLTL
ncbi:hypothetical protein D0Z70_23380 [Sphingobium terrigena]|uniref:Uncharacterized protein n=1 Tax=Sphingobium terrigena TaxID=2304063 RepID=A0A418YJY7_9SPHN|nr:hypothetical protein D0Z70_23380 [Sphingobium terrigena]